MASGPSDHSGTSGTMWNHLEPSGTKWNHLEPSGTTWNHVEPCGTIWNHLEPPGTIWNHHIWTGCAACGGSYGLIEGKVPFALNGWSRNQ